MHNSTRAIIIRLKTRTNIYIHNNFDFGNTKKKKTKTNPTIILLLCTRVYASFIIHII